MKNKKQLEHIPPRWETHQRLKFIEARLYWAGRINRGDIMDYFGVSQPQSSKDLTLYQEIAPNNAVYDKSAKTYRAGERFHPVFTNPEIAHFDGHLQLEDGIIGWVPEIVRMPVPVRQVKPDFLRILLIAIREKQALQIRYQSMASSRSKWRWVTPHALAHDGFRWHIRAYCEKREKWIDFVLGRILQIGEAKERIVNPAEDSAWNEWVTIKYKPHPELTSEQKRTIEQDYGMHNGKGSLKVQKALLFYTLIHLGLDTDLRGSNTQHIVLVNKEVRNIAGLEK